jgi:hypothetical protein
VADEAVLAVAVQDVSTVAAVYVGFFEFGLAAS